MSDLASVSEPEPEVESESEGSSADGSEVERLSLTLADLLDVLLGRGVRLLAETKVAGLLKSSSSISELDSSALLSSSVPSPVAVRDMSGNGVIDGELLLIGLLLIPMSGDGRSSAMIESGTRVRVVRPVVRFAEELA